MILWLDVAKKWCMARSTSRVRQGYYVMWRPPSFFRLDIHLAEEVCVGLIDTVAYSQYWFDHARQSSDACYHEKLAILTYPLLDPSSKVGSYGNISPTVHVVLRVSSRIPYNSQSLRPYINNTYDVNTTCNHSVTTTWNFENTIPLLGNFPNVPLRCTALSVEYVVVSKGVSLSCIIWI